MAYKYIYGPVPSWRLGSSLGVDLISTKDKICTFGCTYCQLGKTINFAGERKVFVPEGEVIGELSSLPFLEIDYITFSGRGEPTLAKNLGSVIDSIKKIRDEKIAILTNSSLMHRKDVREDLLKADFVIAKLDAPSEKIFKLINMPMPGIKFEEILKGIKEFQKEFNGRFALQIMFIKDNCSKAGELARLAREIGPEEVQINTPQRPCGKRPLSKEEIRNIKKYFKGLNVVSVYEAPHKEIYPISSEDTLRRRGKI